MLKHRITRSIQLFLFTVGLASCSTLKPLFPEKPQVTLKSLSVGKINLTEVQLNAALNVLNPNSFVLDLSAIEYEVNAMGLTLGQGTSLETLHLQPGVAQTVNLPLTLSTLSALQFGQAYLSSNKTLPVTLLAKVKVDTPVGPISLNFEDVKDVKASKIR